MLETVLPNAKQRQEIYIDGSPHFKPLKLHQLKKWDFIHRKLQAYHINENGVLVRRDRVKLPD